MWGRPWKRPSGYECELRYEINNKKILIREESHKQNKLGKNSSGVCVQRFFIDSKLYSHKNMDIQGYTKKQHAVTHEDRNSTHR